MRWNGSWRTSFGLAESPVGWAPPTAPKPLDGGGLHRWAVPTLRDFLTSISDHTRPPATPGVIRGGPFNAGRRPRPPGRRGSGGTASGQERGGPTRPGG